MLRCCITRILAPGASTATLFTFFKTNSSYDIVESGPTAQAMLEEKKNETGEDRVRKMFKPDEFGGISAELESVSQIGCLSLFFGACYGGFIQSRKAYVEFMERNQATAFTDHLEAKKKLQDAVTVNFAKGAFKWGWRLCFFSTSYCLISTVVSVYRDKTSVWEYVVAGCITGALYKFRMGPRAMIVGGTLGTMLGTFAGGMTVLLVKLSGLDVRDIRNWQHGMQSSREQALADAVKAYNTREDGLLFKRHNMAVGKEGSSLDNLKLDETQNKDGEVNS